MDFAAASAALRGVAPDALARALPIPSGVAGALEDGLIGIVSSGGGPPVGGFECRWLRFENVAVLVRTSGPPRSTDRAFLDRLVAALDVTHEQPISPPFVAQVPGLAPATACPHLAGLDLRDPDGDRTWSPTPPGVPDAVLSGGTRLPDDRRGFGLVFNFRAETITGSDDDGRRVASVSALPSTGVYAPDSVRSGLLGYISPLSPATHVLDGVRRR